jgi:tetratricopeptide (TPR) repeat protein
MFTYHLQMGMSKLGEKNPTGALVELTEAERLYPNDPDLLFYLGRAYFEKRKYLLAEEKYLRLLKLKPANSSARNDLGVTYLELQRWDDAVSQFKLVLDDIFYQGHNEARLNLGLAYYGKGDYAKALEEFRPLLIASSRDPRPRYHIGRVYLATGKTELALAELNRTVEIFPGFVPAHYQLALAYQKDGKSSQARNAFSEVVRLAPDSELGQLAREQLHQMK